VAPPGSTGAMTSPDALPGYLALIPPGYDWPNRFLPRGTMSLPVQVPYRKAKRVTVPMLVQVMTDDVVTPPEPARKAAQAAPRGELIEYPGGHFDIYVGEPFERAVTDQLEFLERVL
jgi:pimeloyl-ACP methyl ester carboxylesterase